MNVEKQSRRACLGIRGARRPFTAIGSTFDRSVSSRRSMTRRTLHGNRAFKQRDIEAHAPFSPSPPLNHFSLPPPPLRQISTISRVLRIFLRIQSSGGKSIRRGYNPSIIFPSAIGIFTASLYHLPCTVRPTICIVLRVGLMESPGSRERTHT